jgi:hypothetical protein
MLQRVQTIALAAYRESVRARILLGLAGVAFAVSVFSLVIGSFTLNNAPRVVSDLGAASISLFGRRGGDRHRRHQPLPRARAEDDLPDPRAADQPRRIRRRQVPRQRPHHRGLHRRRLRARAVPRRRDLGASAGLVVGALVGLAVSLGVLAYRYPWFSDVRLHPVVPGVPRRRPGAREQRPGRAPPDRDRGLPVAARDRDRRRVRHAAELVLEPLPLGAADGRAVDHRPLGGLLRAVFRRSSSPRPGQRRPRCSARSSPTCRSTCRHARS